MDIDKFFFWDAVVPLLVLLSLSSLFSLACWIGLKKSTTGSIPSRYYSIGFVLWTLTLVLITYFVLGDMWEITGRELVPAPAQKMLSSSLTLLSVIDLTWVIGWLLLAVLWPPQTE